MKTRYETLDLLRGMAIVGMIAFHAMYDLKYIFGVLAPWFDGKVVLYWQSAVGITFILISGGVSGVSKNLLRRGVMILCLALGLSLFTFIFFPEIFIAFGVLHFFGSAMIITAIIKSFFNKIPSLVGFVVSILLFVVTRFIYFGYIFIPFMGDITLSSDLYKTDFLFIFGFPYKGFNSSDYYPILPWYFMFMTGYFGLKILAKTGYQKYLHFTLKPFNFLGIHSLLIYIIHQPIIYFFGALLFDKIL